MVNIAFIGYYLFVCSKEVIAWSFLIPEAINNRLPVHTDIFRTRALKQDVIHNIRTLFDL